MYGSLLNIFLIYNALILKLHELSCWNFQIAQQIAKACGKYIFHLHVNK